MLAELGVLERQEKIAAGRMDTDGQKALGKLLDSLAGLVENPPV